MDDITADSVPVYDVPFWPWDKAWGCAEWMAWHKALADKYGRESANKQFLEAWNKQSFWSWNESFCKYQGRFEDYFKSQGLDPSNFMSEIVGNVKDTSVNLSKGAKSISSTLASNTLLKVLGLVGVGSFLYYWILIRN